MRTLDLRGAGGLAVAARQDLLAGFLRCGEVAVEVGGDQPGQQVVEGLVVVHPDGPNPAVRVFVDVDLGAEGLVEQPPHVVVGMLVGGIAVAGQVEGVGEDGAGLFEVGVGDSEMLPDTVELAPDPALFGLE